MQINQYYLHCNSPALYFYSDGSLSLLSSLLLLKKFLNFMKLIAARIVEILTSDMHKVHFQKVASIDFLFSGEEKKLDEHDPRLQPSDTFLIPSQPSRRGKTPEVSHKTNTHVLITFGLQVLHADVQN